MSLATVPSGFPESRASGAFPERRCRLLTSDDAPTVADLVSRSFHTAVAPHFNALGCATFQALSTPEALRDRLQGPNRGWGCFEDSVLVGMAEVRPGPHLALFFTAPELQGQGIGRCLLNHILEWYRSAPDSSGFLTVNASPNAVTAYETLGFLATAPEQEQDGIRFRPMVRPLT